MQKRIKIKAVTREKDAAGKFQTNLTPDAQVLRAVRVSRKIRVVTP